MWDITTPADGGNIELLDVDPLALRLRPDRSTDDVHWFLFTVSGPPATVRIVNAGASKYDDGWPGFRVVSGEGLDWVRQDTTYEDGVLSFGHPGGTRSYAPSAPYPWQRHLARSPKGTEVLGHSVRGRPMHVHTFGTGAAPVWVIARQHPGEPMGEWFAEGFLDRLRAADAEVAELLARATVHVVPCMNPDGAALGHHRTNWNGVDLNRAWADPTGAPEVACVRHAMDRTGVAVAVDVHGDETIPYVFSAGPEGVPGVTDAVVAAHRTFRRVYQEVTADFQAVHGYESDRPQTANLTLCTNQITHRYGCLGVTLEQPFLDHLDNPEPIQGWSARRSRDLGRDLVPVLLAVL